VALGGGLVTPTTFSIGPSGAAAVDVGRASGFGAVLLGELDGSISGGDLPGSISVGRWDLALLARWRFANEGEEQLQLALGPDLQFLSASSAGYRQDGNKNVGDMGLAASVDWRHRLTQAFDFQVGPEIRYWFQADTFSVTGAGSVASPQVLLGLELRLGWTIL
jgi:hypothetical protein